MSLQAQDVLVALRLGVGEPASYAQLAHELGLSASQVHASVARCRESGLVEQDEKRANVSALREFLVHGLKYVFPPTKGPTVRGVPTAHSAAPLSSKIRSGDTIVWPHPEGTARGESLAPLHKAAPGAALTNPRLHRVLALADAIRAGRARERALAATLLDKELGC